MTKSLPLILYRCDACGCKVELALAVGRDVDDRLIYRGWAIDPAPEEGGPQHYCPKHAGLAPARARRRGKDE